MFILKIIGFLYRQLCSLQSRCCSYKVYVVRSKWWCCLCKVVILCTKSWHCLYKLNIACSKLILLVYTRHCSFNVTMLFVQSYHSLYRRNEVNVVHAKFWTKKKENWQANFDTETASYKTSKKRFIIQLLLVGKFTSERGRVWQFCVRAPTCPVNMFFTVQKMHNVIVY